MGLGTSFTHCLGNKEYTEGSDGQGQLQGTIRLEIPPTVYNGSLRPRKNLFRQFQEWGKGFSLPLDRSVLFAKTASGLSFFPLPHGLCVTGAPVWGHGPTVLLRTPDSETDGPPSGLTMDMSHYLSLMCHEVPVARMEPFYSLLTQSSHNSWASLVNSLSLGSLMSTEDLSVRCQNRSVRGGVRLVYHGLLIPSFVSILHRSLTENRLKFRVLGQCRLRILNGSSYPQTQPKERTKGEIP